MNITDKLDIYLITEKQKEYIYYVKGFDEVLSVWANNEKAAISKLRKEYGLPNWNPKIMER